MKVLVVNNAAPFIRGGAEELADQLVRRLNATPGVQSELLRLPFRWSPSERLIEEILIHRGLRLHNVDRVIGLKFPAYLIPHSHKTLWLLHQFRQAYDLGDVGQGLDDHGPEGRIKAAIRAADNRCFQECGAIFTNSPVTQGRLKRYNNVDSSVLYPPLNDEALFNAGDYGAYIFAGGRVAPGKRQHLLIEAMSRAPSVGRLVIAGPPESQSYKEELQALVARQGLEARVDLHFGFHPREDIARWVSGALACAYIPYDEDSLGYVTMEAFASAKAVLTTTDSGGLLGMVNEHTGMVTLPDADALAQGLAALWENPKRTCILGGGAQEAWRQRDISWDATIKRLL